MNYLHFFKTKNKLGLHKKVCKNKDLGNVVMPCEDTKILQFKQNQKPEKTPFIIYADLISLIKKMDGCKYNPGKSSTAKVGEDIPSGCSLSTRPLFKD